MIEARLSNHEWAAQFKSVSTWFDRKKKSRDVQVSILRGWYEWASENVDEVKGHDPDRLVKWAQGVTPRELIPITESVEAYLRSNQDRWRLGYQRRIYGAVRSFFKSNWAELPDNGEIYGNLTSDLEDAPENLTLETLKTVCVKSNQMYRAIFLSMFAGSMGVEELIRWNGQGVGSVGRGLIKVDGERVLKIDLPLRQGRSRKRNTRPFYTLIGGDALGELEKWLRVRERQRAAYEERHSKPYPDAIFVTNNNTPLDFDTTLRTYWLRKLHQLGIIDRARKNGPGTRYGYHVHQVRDLFSTQMHGKFDKDVKEFLMGHVTDPNRYDKFYNDVAYVAREYLKGIPYLNILTSALPFGLMDASAQQQQVESLQHRIKELEAQLEDERKTHTKIEEVQQDLKQGSEDLKAIVYIKNEQQEKLQQRVKELEGQLQNRNGQIQNLKNDFKTELKSELQKEKEAREEFQKQMIQIMRQTGSEWRLSIGLEAILKEIAATERAIEFFESQQDPQDNKNAEVMRRHLSQLKHDLEQGRGEEFWVVSHPSPSPLNKVLNENKKDEEEKINI
jgi:hypothetical protein